MEVNSSCASFSSPPKDKNNDPQFQLISSKEYERSNNRFNTRLVREVRRLLKRVNPGHHPLVKRQNSIHWQEYKELRRNEKNCYLHNTSLQPRASQFSNSDKFILFFSLCLFSKTLTFFVGWKEPLEEFYGFFWLAAVAYQSYFLKSWFSFGIAYGCIIEFLFRVHNFVTSHDPIHHKMLSSHSFHFVVDQTLGWLAIIHNEMQNVY